MGTTFMQMAYNLTDMFWLGRVGSDAVAASGAAGNYMWLSFCFTLFGRMGAEIGVAQSLGQGDRKNARSYSQNSLLINGAIGLLFGLVMFFFRDGLAAFYRFKEPQVAAAASSYIGTVAVSIPVTFITQIIVGTFNSSGNSRTPFIINSVGLVANVLLDPLFILVFGWGVTGAAAATVISQCIVCVGMIWGILLYRGRPFESYSFRFKIDLKKITTILRWSAPIALEAILFCFLSMLCARLETAFGVRAVAASRVGSQVESLSWLVGGGFGSALVAFIGQNYGAAKRDRIKRGVRLSVVIMAIWGTLITVLLWTCGGLFISLFLPEVEIVSLGRLYLRIFAICHIFMNLETVASGAFKGQGKTIPPSLVSITCNALRPILAFFLSRTSLGLYGIWVGITLCTIIRGTWLCFWYIKSEAKGDREDAEA
jgi:putative MATE family efflux protein